MATAEQGQAKGTFFYGWIIVGATFVLLMIMSGITYSTPVLFRFFEADFAIGRAQAAFLFSVSQVAAFVVGAVAGGLAEKYGPRVVVGGGILAMAVGPGGRGLGQLLCHDGGLLWRRRRARQRIGLHPAARPDPALVLQTARLGDRPCHHRSRHRGPDLSRPVRRRRQRLRLAPPVFRFCRICVLIGLVAVSFLVADPKELGLAPDGARRRGGGPARNQAVAGLGLGEVLRDRQFYLIYFSSFGAAVLSFMAFVHLPQQLVESGRDQMQAATIVAVIGLFSLAARLGGGAWADRVGRVAMIRVALVIMLLTSVLWAANPWGADVFYVVAALFGITYGLSIALLPTVIADSFGNKAISRIIGVMYTSFALAAFVGPTVAGLLHDRYGDYSLALDGCIVLSALSLLASVGITRRF